MMRFLGLFALIPVTLLITLSFFVTVVGRRQEKKQLKQFGFIVAVLLWISAALIFAAGVFTIATGKHPMMAAMQEMMKECPMMKGQMPMMMPQGPMSGQNQGQMMPPMMRR